MNDDADAIDRFWALARGRAHLTGVPGYFGPTTLEVLRPPAWAFGGDPAEADVLLELVLAGTKTATASAAWEYDATDEPRPEPGALSIVLDGVGRPRALIVTTEVAVVPFAEVDAEHARLEGEGDRSLAAWREVHERSFAAHAGHAVTPAMPVVLERFRVLYTDR